MTAFFGSISSVLFSALNLACLSGEFDVGFILNFIVHDFALFLSPIRMTLWGVVQRMTGEICWKVSPVSAGDDTKTAPTGDTFDQTRCERSSMWTEQSGHIGKHVVLFPGGDVLLTFPGIESSNPPPSPIR